MGNWNQGSSSSTSTTDDAWDSYTTTVSTTTSSSSDNNNDTDFFTGTFDNPGEPGFSGPSYEGQYGTDSEGTTWTPEDTAHADWYEFDKFESALDKIDALTNRNFNKQVAVLGSNMEVRGYSPYGGRYNYDDAAFYSRAIGEYGIAGDLYSQRPEGFKDRVTQFVENVASGVTERFGTSFTKNYAIDPREGYVGEITEDYGFTDLIGNLIGTMVPGGAKVDRYSSKELTKTGLGQRQFGNYSIFGGAIEGGYAMTPEQEEAMFEKARQEAEEERARGGSDPSVEPAVTAGVAAATSQARLRSALLPSFMQTQSFAFNLLGPELLPPVYDAAQDFFRSSTLISGGNYGSAFGFASGGQAGPESEGNENVSGPVGFVGDVPEGVSEAGTVADDVPMEVEEGTYILNAAAVEFAGSEDIKKMILQAISEAERQGVDIQPNVDRIKLDNQVSLLVSRGEVVIPPKIAKIIGYDRLEKINNRGKQEVEKRVSENGQSPEAEATDQAPQNPAEGMAFAPGGKVGGDYESEAYGVRKRTAKEKRLEAVSSTPEQRINANFEEYPQLSRLQLMEGGGGSTSQKTIPFGDSKQKGFDVRGEYYGKGFIARGGVRGSQSKSKQAFPDGVVQNQKGESIGFTAGGEMYLSDDTALRASISRDANRSKGKVQIPTGETIEFGGGEKFKRYDMGMTFDAVGVDVFKEQSSGEDTSGGQVAYQFSDNGQLYIKGTEGGKSGEVGIRYTFSKGGKTSHKEDRYIRPDQRPGVFDYSLIMQEIKKKFRDMRDNPPPIKEAKEPNDRLSGSYYPEAFTGDMLIQFDNFLKEELNTDKKISGLLYQDLMDEAMNDASAESLEQYFYFKGVEEDGTPTDMSDRDVTEQKKVRKQIKSAKELYHTPSFLMS
jgi:hypothetical protein